MCVDLRIRPSGSALGCMYCASLGLVTSTTGHCSNFRSAKLNRSWSTARTLYLQTERFDRTICVCRSREEQQQRRRRRCVSLQPDLRLSIQSPSSSSRVPRGCRLCRTGIRPPSVCKWPQR